MFEDIKKGFGLTIGFCLAACVWGTVASLVRDKEEENNETSEEKGES